MENPIEMDDLGVPIFLETPTYRHKSLNLNQKGRILFQATGLG